MACKETSVSITQTIIEGWLFYDFFFEGRIIFLVGLGLKYEWFNSSKTNVMHAPKLSVPSLLKVCIEERSAFVYTPEIEQNYVCEY